MRRGRLGDSRPRRCGFPGQLDDGNDALLPAMQADCTLACGNRVISIEAKYYGKRLQTHFGVCHNPFGEHLSDFHGCEERGCADGENRAWYLRDAALRKNWRASCTG